MFEKANRPTLLLHIYIITYLIVTMANASDSVMQIMHIICPFVVLPFLYHSIKAAGVANKPSVSEENEESYKAL